MQLFTGMGVVASRDLGRLKAREILRFLQRSDGLEKGSKHASPEDSCFARYVLRIGVICQRAESGSRCWGGSGLPGLSRTDPGLRLRLLPVLSVRLCALWLVRTRLVRRRSFHRSGAMVPRLPWRTGILPARLPGARIHWSRPRLRRRRARLRRTWRIPARRVRSQSGWRWIPRWVPWRHGRWVPRRRLPRRRRSRRTPIDRHWPDSDKTLNGRRNFAGRFLLVYKPA
jgi:hypothetical protein